MFNKKFVAGLLVFAFMLVVGGVITALPADAALSTSTINTAIDNVADAGMDSFTDVYVPKVLPVVLLIAMLGIVIGVVIGFFTRRRRK